MNLDESSVITVLSAQTGSMSSLREALRRKKCSGAATEFDLQTDYAEDVTITLLEDDNENVIKSLYGDNQVIIKPGSEGTQKTIYHTKNRLPIKSHVLRAVDGDKLKDYVILRGVSPLWKRPLMCTQHPRSTT